MRARLAATLLLIVVPGYAGEVRLPYQPAPVSYDNPVLIRIPNHELVWDSVVDVISDYFRIEREDPVRLLGGTYIDGRIDTFPKPGATLLEPWDHDSANSYERLESTLQTIRRYAVVKVIHAENCAGFWVEVAVYKELENLPRPEHATAGSAIFRNDISPGSATPAGTQPGSTVNPATNATAKPGQPPTVVQPWIPQGRDTAVEQLILGQILDRFTPNGKPIPVN